MKKFISGILVGSLAATTAVVGSVAFTKKAVVDPTDKKEVMIGESREKAMRKRVPRQ